MKKWAIFWTDYGCWSTLVWPTMIEAMEWAERCGNRAKVYGIPEDLAGRTVVWEYEPYTGWIEL